tara:strand:+ start:641 stop:943 length:303 start_codon:yes stop_codon:yes gene_type:complete
MSKENSSMSPKRLFILLTLAGLLMWLFSKSKVEVDLSIDTLPNQKEELQSEKIENKEFEEEKVEFKSKKKKRLKKKEKQKKQDDYLNKRDLDYDPSTRNK